MFSSKAVLTGMPVAMLAAGCIIVPGDPSLATLGGGRAPGIPGPVAASPAPDTGKRAAAGSSREVTVPVIASLTASPTNLTRPGQEVVFHIEAVDASGTPGYTWSATGGTLTTTAGTRVGWRSPAQAGRYTVLVVVSSPSGGATTGAVNIEVRPDGTATVVPEQAVPSPPPPSPLPFPSPSPIPSVCTVHE